MAEIFAFPRGSATMRHPDADMPERPVGVPDAVWSAVESVRSMPRVTGMRYRELPVPSTLADYGIGVEMECVADDDSRSFGDAHMASGWIMLLYVEREREDWHSHWRCVAYAQLPLPSDENDGLAPSMYWDGMCSFVDDASLGDVSGTVTVTQNTSFGLAQEGTAGCEMRVSWTPLASMDGGLDAGGQVQCWARFVQSASGLPVRPCNVSVKLINASSFVRVYLKS